MYARDANSCAGCGRVRGTLLRAQTAVAGAPYSRMPPVFGVPSRAIAE